MNFGCFVSSPVFIEFTLNLIVFFFLLLMHEMILIRKIIGLD